MATYKHGTDISTLEVAGYDLKPDLRSLTIAGNADELDASVITQDFGRVNAGQRQYNISFSTISQTGSGTCATKVNSSHLSVFTIGGTDYKARFKSASMGINTIIADTSAGADVFKSGEVIQWNWEGSAELMVTAAATQAIFTTFKTSASGLSAVWSMTLNGVAITYPAVITSVELVEDGANVTMLRVGLKGLPPCTGTYPTAPTTASDLLTSFLVDPKSTATFEFESAASNGENLNGSVNLQSLSFSISAGQIVETSWNFLSTGVMA